jgi:hypothetical protein
MELPAKYNDLTFPQRREVRLAYIKQQEGLCYYCKDPLDGQPTQAMLDKEVNTRLFPEGFFTHPIHLHHCHRSGLTLGAVHCHCNAVLWQYEGE